MKTYNEYTEPKHVAELLLFIANGSANSPQVREECRKAAKLAGKLHATPQPIPVQKATVGGCAFQQATVQKEYPRTYGSSTAANMTDLLNWLTRNVQYRARIEHSITLSNKTIEFIYSVQT